MYMHGGIYIDMLQLARVSSLVLEVSIRYLLHVPKVKVFSTVHSCYCMSLLLTSLVALFFRFLTRSALSVTWNC